MRLFATLLLVLMTAIFIVTTVVKLDWPWIPYVRAFAEAGMVGACADWFAIVALFRRPLGLPIPTRASSPTTRTGSASRQFHHQQFTAAVMNERLAHRQWARGPVLSEPANANGSETMSRCNCRRFARSLPCRASAN
jgi:uncharacterized membrane-anchored protein YjiN (DUF445 family)